MPKLQRPTNGRIIAGVCAALGERFGVSRNIVRLVFVLSTLLPGPQFLIYLILWAVIPSETASTEIDSPVI
jgi:phage shock protein PspC (stress-responsive transcriptional regulator)